MRRPGTAAGRAVGAVLLALFATYPAGWSRAADAPASPPAAAKPNIDNMASMARVCNCSIFVKNEASYAGLALGGEGYTSFTIASPTGEGLTTAVHFTRERRCTLKEAFRFV